MLATSVNRVESRASHEVNERIRRETEEGIRRHVAEGLERMKAARLVPSTLLFGLLLLLPAVADACPVCESETGREVRAGIFGEDFGPNLLMTLLPFPILLGIAAAFYFGFSPKETAAEPIASGSPTEAHESGFPSPG